jgi:hypothetical protein
MATKTEKTTDTKAAKAAPKAAAPKAAPKAKATKTAAAARPSGPRAALIAKHGDREKLLKSLVDSVAKPSDDAGALATTLGKVSNQKLLRLADVAERVKAKYGSRAKLVAAIGTAHGKSKDKDFLAKLDTQSLPQLLDLAVSGERRARQ